MAIDSAKSIGDNLTKYGEYFEKKEKDSFSMDNFFQLLMAEMSNQDPMEPKSNTEFISQLANFTSLKAQQDALYYQNANYAQSIVGKSVTVASNAGSKFNVENGIVTSMSLVDGDFMVKVNGKDYALASIMEVLPSSNPYTISGGDGAYANSLIGKQATVVGMSNLGAKITETGVVERIEIKDNEISIIIDDKAYPLSSVVKVEPAPPGALEKKDDDEKPDSYYSSDAAREAGEGSSGTKTTETEKEPEKVPETEKVDETDENDEEELKQLFGDD